MRGGDVLYRRLIDLRRQEAALNIGSYESIAPLEGCENLIAYRRRNPADGRELVIALNFASEPLTGSLAGLSVKQPLAEFSIA